MNKSRRKLNSRKYKKSMKSGGGSKKGVYYNKKYSKIKSKINDPGINMLKSYSDGIHKTQNMVNEMYKVEENNAYIAAINQNIKKLNTQVEESIKLSNEAKERRNEMQKKLENSAMKKYTQQDDQYEYGGGGGFIKSKKKKRSFRKKKKSKKQMRSFRKKKKSGGSLISARQKTRAHEMKARRDRAPSAPAAPSAAARRAPSANKSYLQKISFDSIQNTGDVIHNMLDLVKKQTEVKAYQDAKSKSDLGADLDNFNKDLAMINKAESDSLMEFNADRYVSNI